MKQGGTIFALATAAIAAPVAIIRLSGSGCGGQVAPLVGSLPPARTAGIRSLRRPGSAEVLDRALVLWFPGPRSATGEDALELHLHGGLAVVAAVTEALVTLGCRPAEPGEFSRRAFLNGKLDLTAAEGIADLVAAETEGQRRQAMRQASGGLAKELIRWDQDLLRLLAHQEANIEFADEGLPTDLDQTVRAGIGRLQQDLAAHLKAGEKARRLRSGVSVVILGAPNVGKSSLLNHLARSDAAIVSRHPGTTRDIVEVRLDLDGIPVTLSDTAGIRDTVDEIEAEGIRRALEKADIADLVILMTAPDIPAGADLPPMATPVLRVSNKADLLAAPTEGLVMSTLTGAGLDAFDDVLRRQVKMLAGVTATAALSRPRHIAAVSETAIWLATALDAAMPEIVAECLRAARRTLGRITGQGSTEAVLDAVFRDFCIGK
ncbi:tRNA uridine-5-carboxymethylaminomethyl(34) synthesis GTPase MnmE [Humitalea sp. 24SJ18S-53]|uniref:tRNA uridine-5-carboxymethylaminomethyl(34) synthesis GTPase MnmE n=1 Tax=Humitalea sp. 24SJ18S-53 TaxID=3422307 RepID=UPI003D67F3B6